MTLYKKFLSRWGMMLAFLILAGAGMYAVNAQAQNNAQTLYRTQLASCHRANVLRAESNDRVDAHLLERNVLSEFLSSAAAARKAAGTPLDSKAAADYLDLKDSLKRVQYQRVPTIDCEKTIEKP